VVYKALQRVYRDLTRRVSLRTVAHDRESGTFSVLPSDRVAYIVHGLADAAGAKAGAGDVAAALDYVTKAESYLMALRLAREEASVAGAYAAVTKLRTGQERSLDADYEKAMTRTTERTESVEGAAAERLTAALSLIAPAHAP